MSLAFATAAALAAQGGAPVANSFDLAQPAKRTILREDAAPPAPVAPRNLDTRDFAVDAPEFEMALGESGGLLLIGAMGGRQGKVFDDLPKLAHVAVGWSF